MTNNQLKRCAKGLHQYRERRVKDLGGNSFIFLKCDCGHEYQKLVKK